MCLRATGTRRLYVTFRYRSSVARTVPVRMRCG
jgi:hypothetical protein